MALRGTFQEPGDLCELGSAAEAAEGSGVVHDVLSVPGDTRRRGVGSRREAGHTSVGLLI
ncbi:hypothetical protein Scani_44450 [Streptomyces caniferus]|uniref:Uncharacterized protein n=1 Tax=Streptomyces caniferus TaxID=285557 RepID=A0A640SAK9_9ACTN|nr:hypothetical protein Scani_44450 [Streptomyces caniferus]